MKKLQWKNYLGALNRKATFCGDMGRGVCVGVCV